jgi:cell division initiation protein
MPLTPIDVQQKTFGTALRGYDLDEVDDFLDDVVTSLKDYEQRLRDAQERIATLEMEMTDRGDAEGAIARALVAAQRSADSIISDAKAEADRIIGDATAEAAEAGRARAEEKATADLEISRIRAVVDDLRSRVADLAAAVGANLDQMDMAMSTATADLEPEVTEAAVTEAEEAQTTWEQSSAAEDLDEEVDDASVDIADDGFEDDEEDDIVPTPDWAMRDEHEDEHPVRPWEVG